MFRPTPPPPRPPVAPGRSDEQAGRAPSTRPAGRRAVIEAIAGLAVLVALAGLAWPNRPAPLDAAEAWSQRAAPVVDALATDVAAGSSQPSLSAPTARRLAADLRTAERVTPPPDHLRSDMWRKARNEVQTALALRRADPSAARAALNLAALEISGLSAVAQGQ